MPGIRERVSKIHGRITAESEREALEATEEASMQPKTIGHTSCDVTSKDYLQPSWSRTQFGKIKLHSFNARAANCSILSSVMLSCSKEFEIVMVWELESIRNDMLFCEVNSQQASNEAHERLRMRLTMRLFQTRKRDGWVFWGQEKA